MTEPEILRRETTTSTMDDAREAILGGAGHWTVCLAGSQTRGRGRIPGRRWDDGGQSLLFTLIIDRAEVRSDYPLTQLLALALCRCMKEIHGLSPRIKWPNDVLLEGRKLAGILVETQGTYMLAGMGINILQTEFPTDLRRPAVSLSMALKDAGRPDPDLTAENRLPVLLSFVEDLLHNPPGIEEVASLLSGLGGEVTVDLGDPSRNETLTGTITGLKEDGALLVRDDSGGIRTIYSGEMAENS